ncbi:hypothetical protein CHS0354_008774 [Potamilus streckersoni]|uniref:Uncharacterized protein n=1 Tax=Potamilus streckersoni TaxID=2493646 RepID=A0AAE0W031_9BIVA|nr:hypothetical protein CHS0354_008774 [Potamilus streckersoni]
MRQDLNSFAEYKEWRNKNEEGKKLIEDTFQHIIDEADPETNEGAWGTGGWVSTHGGFGEPENVVTINTSFDRNRKRKHEDTNDENKTDQTDGFNMKETMRQILQDRHNNHQYNSFKARDINVKINMTFEFFKK